MMTSSDVEILALSSQISMHRISWISLQFLLNVTKPQIWLGNTQHWNKQLKKTKNLIATRLHRKYWFKQRYQFKIPHGLSRLKTSLFHILQVSRVTLYPFFSRWSFGILLWELCTMGKDTFYFLLINFPALIRTERPCSTLTRY